jgi:hypothetical protein
MDDLKNALIQRFPLLTSLRICRDSAESEELAAFIGVLLAAIEDSRYASFCFVFPRKDLVAPLTAVLYSLGKFAVEFPKLAEEYAHRSFRSGQRVRIVPEGKIFVFGGVWPGLETSFRLKILNENASFTWPVSEILRIEATERKIPKGYFADGDKARKKAPLSALDKLIGTKTFGNTSLAVNHVLYLGNRSEMDEFLQQTRFMSSASLFPHTVGGLLSAGNIDGSGAITHYDSYKAAGEPLIATSARIENVASACINAAPHSKVVIVDGARRITDLSKYDSIAETQKVIIVSDPDEEEKLRELHDRGCKFWRFSLEDLEIGQRGSNGGGRFFAKVFQSARNAAELRTEVYNCFNPCLEQASVALETCQKSLEESESDATRMVLVQIYSLLTHCSALLEPPEVDELERLRTKCAEFTARAEQRLMWLPDPAARALQEACEALKRAIEDTRLGVAKGTALRELLFNLERDGVTEIGFVARSAANLPILSKWMAKQGMSHPVLLVTAVDSGFFKQLICTAWPNSEKFGRIVKQNAAPVISLMAYPFERCWLQMFRRRQQKIDRVPSLDSSEKSELLGLMRNTAWPQETVVSLSPEVPSQTILTDYDFEESFRKRAVLPAAQPGEDNVSTRLVNFSDGSYAFVTETLRIPVITELVSGTVGKGFKIPLRKLKETHPGDVLVFRESGRRDVIRALADAQLGQEAPVIREIAARWQQALRESGVSEAGLIQKLVDVNCNRNLQTVRLWLTDDSMIGPLKEADLEAIAYALGDQKLLERAPAIWKAIQTLRREHTSAGVRLTRILLDKLPERLEELRDGRAHIEIDNATSAWIVQVDSISDRTELRPRSQVNTVIVYDDSLFLFEGMSWQR